MARLYIVETHDGEWRIYRSTPFRELIHLVPRIKSGTLTLDGCVYVVDPSRFRRIPFKPKKSLKLTVDYILVQLWKENDPEPQPLFKAHERDDDISGTTLSQLSRSERLRRLVQPETDIMSLLLGLGLVMSIVANIVLAYRIAG